MSSYDSGHIFEQVSETIELDYCTRCIGLEGSLTTDCPGQPMAEEESARVYAGGYDYRAGEGWVRKPSPMGQSIIQRRLVDMYMGREYAHKHVNEIILELGLPKSEVLPYIKEHEKWVLKREGYI